MPAPLHARGRRAALATLLALALAGCGALRPAPPALTSEEAAAFDESETGAVRTFLDIADGREDGADWLGALTATRKALRHQPRSRAALLRRAELLLHLEEATGILAYRVEARAILQRFADDVAPEARLATAWLGWRDGEGEDALAAARVAADAAPEDARVQRLLAHVLLGAGDVGGALRAAERAVELDPASQAALRERARARLRRMELDAAAQDAAVVLRSEPDDPVSSCVLADTFLRRGDPETARRVLARVTPDRRDADLLRALGRLEASAVDAAAGRVHLERALALRPHDARTLELLVGLDAREGRADESVARLDAAVAELPEDAALARVRGVALAAAGREADAAQALADALALDPDAPVSYAALVGLLRARDPDAAERRAAELAPAPGPGLVLAGMLREARGDRDGALAHYRRAMDADRELAAARRAAAAALATSGRDPDAALALAREARAARPADPLYADTLGLAHLRRGQGAAALEVLREAAGAVPIEAPAFAEITYHLALAHDAVGEHAAARSARELALAAAATQRPEPAWARQARAASQRAQPPAPSTATGAAAEPVAETPAEASAAAAPDARSPEASAPATPAEASTAGAAPAGAPSEVAPPKGSEVPRAQLP